jgi:Flp pilus assembly protein TadG
MFDATASAESATFKLIAIAIQAIRHTTELRNRAMRTIRRAAAHLQSGQILIALAVIIPVLVAAASLGVDISIFYFNWAGMQAAADNAALAGAAYLPNDTAGAKSATTSYAVSNGALASEVAAPTFGSNNNSIAVSITRQVAFRFASALGLIKSPITVNATATLMNTSTASGAFPIGLSSQTTYTDGQSITIHNGRVGAGNWDALALGCTGGSCYSNNLAAGYSSTLSVGELVTSEPGNMVGPTDSGVATRVSSGQTVDPGGTATSHTLDDPRIVIVPVVNWAGCHGRCSIPIVAFATLWITGASGGDINAVFIGSLAPNATPTSGGSNYGAYQAVLTK